MSKKNWPLPLVQPPFLLLIGVLLLSLCLYPFWGAIATAAVFAFGLKTPLEHLRAHSHIGRRVSVSLTIVVMLLLLLIPATFLGLRLYQIAIGQKEKGISGAFSSDTVAKASLAYRQVEEKLATFGANKNFYKITASARQGLNDVLASGGKGALAFLLDTFLSIPDLIVTLIVFSLFLYLFLARGPRIGAEIERLGFMRADDIKRVSNILSKSSYSSLVTNIFVGAIQATVIVAGARIFGFKESVLIFTIVFFLSFIPFIGASPIAFALALIAFLTGNTGQGIGMLVVGVIGGAIDNIIRPFLISESSAEVHPVMSFATVIGAISIFGIKGIFLGPVILTATFALLYSEESPNLEPTS